MNRLGFAIKLASQGAGNAIECNKGQWTSKVVDIREYLKLFNGLQGTDNIVTFMSFDEGGCFLTLLRAIPGRIGDFLSGWIYIPNTIEALGEDIMNTFNYVRNILSMSNLNDYMDDIQSFFSKEYPNKKLAARYQPSSGEKFGVRFLDRFYSMKEILGADRYQPYYSRYKAIFLLEQNSEVKVAGEQATKFEDLTEWTIDKTCIFNAPSTENVRSLGRGARILLSNKQEFNSPILVKEGDAIQLLVQRDGFETIPLPKITIKEDGQKCIIDPKTVIWYKRISSSMFKVYNRQREMIDGVMISVNGTRITPGYDVKLTEDDCMKARIKCSAPNYEPYEYQHNLLSGSVEITLSREVKSYQQTIELINGHRAKMKLESKYLPSNYNYESPLKGYDFEDDSGEKVLKLSLWFVWMERLKGFCAAVAALLIIIAYVAFDAWLDTHQFKWGLPPWEEIRSSSNTETSTETDANSDDHTDNKGEAAQTTQEDLSLAAAIQYLDGNFVWKKTEMEKYPDLKGLFEDMNEFNLNRIIDEWGNKLSRSDQFKKVCASAKKNRDQGWNPRQGNHNPTYNKQNDDSINLTNYINWLDQDQTPKPSSNSGGFLPNGGNNAGKQAGKSKSTPGGAKSSSNKSGNGNTATQQNGGL